MTWSYSGDPSLSSKDYVRFLTGDTLILDQLFSDEEILSVLAVESDVYNASIIAIESLASRFSRLCDVAVGKTKISYSQRAAGYLAMATSLKATVSQNKALHSIPYAGGISVADKESVRQNTDRVQPDFEKGMFDYSGTGFEGWEP